MEMKLLAISTNGSARPRSGASRTPRDGIAGPWLTIQIGVFIVHSSAARTSNACGPPGLQSDSRWAHQQEIFLDALRSCSSISLLTFHDVSSSPCHELPQFLPWLDNHSSETMSVIGNMREPYTASPTAPGSSRKSCHRWGSHFPRPT